MIALFAVLLPPVPAAVSSGPGTDWPNATYSITCDGLVKNTFSVRLSNSTATVSGQNAGSTDYDQFTVQYQAAANGELAGIGPASAVLLACSPQPSNFAVQEVQVLRPDGSLVSELPSASTLQNGAILPPVYVPSGLRVTGGNISTDLLAYGPNDTHASGPTVRETATLHWNGTSFERSS